MQKAAAATARTTRWAIAAGILLVVLATIVVLILSRGGDSSEPDVPVASVPAAASPAASEPDASVPLEGSPSAYDIAVAEIEIRTDLTGGQLTANGETVSVAFEPVGAGFAAKASVPEGAELTLFGTDYRGNAKEVNHRLGAERVVNMGTAMVEFAEGELSGFMDKTGYPFIAPTYKLVGRFSDGLANVMTETGKWSFLTGNGEAKLTVEAAWAGPASEGFAAIGETDVGCRYIAIDNGEAVPGEFMQCDSFADGLAAVQNDNGLWGYIDTEGRYAIEPAYEMAFPFSQGYATVAREDEQLGSIFSIIDKQGKEMFAYRGANSTNRVSEGYFAQLVSMNGMVGYYKLDPEASSATGVTVEGADMYFDAATVSEGIGSIRLPDDTWQYVDMDGNLLFGGATFAVAGPFREGLAFAIASDGRSGYMDRTGRFADGLPAQPLYGEGGGEYYPEFGS